MTWLNNQFRILASTPGSVSVHDCLKEIAEKTPYRWLNEFSRNVEKTLSPIKSWEDTFKAFPDHLKFIQKIKSAQTNANVSGRRIQIC